MPLVTVTSGAARRRLGSRIARVFQQQSSNADATPARPTRFRSIPASVTNSHPVLARVRRPILRSGALALLAATILPACSGDATGVAATQAPRPAAVSIVSGSGQSAVINTALPAALTVLVTTAQGTPVAGATVAFAVSAGTGTLSPTFATTGVDGTASTQLTLGATPGAVEVTATVQSTTLATRLVATAGAAPAAVASDCTDPGLLMRVGQVAVLTGVTSLCLPGGTSGAEYALIPFNGSTSASGRATFSVQPSGVTGTSTLGNPIADAGGLTGGTSGLSTLVAAGTRRPLRTLDARLHAQATLTLAPRMRAAREWYGTRSGSATGPRRSVVARTVAAGDLVSLNTNADDACTDARMRTGRVAAVGTRSVVVADTGNPTGGFSDADYQSIAATFDTLVAPLGGETFGEPTDIDNNGKVVLFFTREVNALTPGNSGAYVGGFFWSRDLFPQTASVPSDACAGSNVGEMFYLMVPDPRGSINGNAFSTADARGFITGTIAHEYQHLINSSRRLYVNTTADAWEETWLDEGLSHIAEELVFYRASGLTPRSNLDATALRRSSRYVSAFNDYQLDNFGRYADFLTSTTGNSPYANDDSLATRGATWAFLRYAADQQGSDGTVWRQLVNAPSSGFANLRGVFGSGLTSLVRDWSTAMLTDDLTGVAARWQQPSWSFRSIFAVLDNGGFPLATPSLASGVARTVTLVPGGSAFLRFGVGANANGALQWTAPASSVQLTLVRTR